MTALAPLPDPPMPLTVRRYITAGDLAELPPLVLTAEQQAALDRAVTTLGELALDTFRRRYGSPCSRPLEARTTWRGGPLVESIAALPDGTSQG